MLLVNDNNTHFHRKNWRSGFITYVQTWRRISKQNKILILMHVSISVLILFPLENFFHVKDWESALLPQRNLKMGEWKKFFFFGFSFYHMMMQLRLVILLLWFGYLHNVVGYIENSNIIYLNFSYGKVAQEAGEKFISWNWTSQPVKWPIHSEKVFLAAILPKQEFIFDCGPEICNQFFTTVASFFPRCNIVSTFTATLLQSMSRSTNISHQMEYLLATGNLVSRSGLGLMQVRNLAKSVAQLNM